jgi:hypothetical protein
MAHMGLLSVLLAWHQQDPVDDKERHRNDAVFQRQGNRNPFIDNPDWVGCLFGPHCVVGGTVTPPGPTGGASVWINEIHYDNAGGDTDEFVEVAGRAETDLSDWKLLGYNGATGAFYRIISLSGSIPDQAGGFGVLAFDFPNLQNGPNDGIALVRGDEVIEFLSYEGTLTATTGTASGRPSVDIGVGETGSTPAGHSLQRRGNGQTAAAFSWSGPAAATKGVVNTGQTF